MHPLRRALTLTLDRAMLPITECKQYNIANGNNQDGSVAEGEVVGVLNTEGEVVPIIEYAPEPGVATMRPITRAYFKLLKARSLTTSCYLAQRKLLIRWLLETYGIYRPELEETIFVILNSQYYSGFGNGGPLQGQGHLSFNNFFNSKIDQLQGQIDALELQGQQEQGQINALQEQQRIYLELCRKLQCLCLLSSNLFRNMQRFSINLNMADDPYIRNLFVRSQYKPIPCTFVVDDTTGIIDHRVGSEVVIHWYIIYRGKIFSTWGSDTFYIKYSHTIFTAQQFIDLLLAMNALNAAAAARGEEAGRPTGAAYLDEKIANRDTFNVSMKQTMLNPALALSVDNIDEYTEEKLVYDPQTKLGKATALEYIDKELTSYKGLKIYMYELLGGLNTSNPLISYIDTLTDVALTLYNLNLLNGQPDPLARLVRANDVQLNQEQARVEPTLVIVVNSKNLTTKITTELTEARVGLLEGSIPLSSLSFVKRNRKVRGNTQKGKKDILDLLYLVEKYNKITTRSGRKYIKGGKKTKRRRKTTKIRRKSTKRRRRSRK